MDQVTHTTQKGINPIAAGAAGVVIGAAGAAMTAVLMHEPTRKKIKPILKKAQDKMKEITKEITSEVPTKDSKTAEEAEEK